MTTEIQITLIVPVIVFVSCEPSLFMDENLLSL